MNVLFINNSEETFTPTCSGAIATHVFECCRAAQAAGDAPTVISRNCGSAPYEGVKTILIDHAPPTQNPVANKILRAQRKLSGWRHLGQKAYAAKVARAIRQADLEKAPMILHNDPEMAVFLRDKFPDAFLIHHFHNQIDSAPNFRRSLRRAVNAVTSVSNFTGRWIEECYGFPKNEVQTIYNGVDIERFTPAEKPVNGLPIINFLGRTGIEKAPDLLLKAAARLVQKMKKPFGVQILGSNHWHKFEADAYQSQLQELSEGLERAGVTVRRPGHITRAALPDELRRARINVVPSRWDEPFALTIIEGMACGLATVVSKTGGAPEVVGEAGFLFERDSVEGLAGQLEQLLSDEEMLACYARRARSRAEEFTWGKTWALFRAAL